MRSLLCGQASRAYPFATSLCVRFCCSHFSKNLTVDSSRYFHREPRATSFDIDRLRKGFFRFSYRGISTGHCYRKQRFTSYDKNDDLSRDEDANISNISVFSEKDDTSSRTRVSSAVAEYTLNEDGYMDIQDLVDFLKRESAMDICVIKTGGHRRSYVDYFVVVSGVSTRHLRAMAKNLEQLVGRYLFFSWAEGT